MDAGGLLRRRGCGAVRRVERGQVDPDVRRAGRGLPGPAGLRRGGVELGVGTRPGSHCRLSERGVRVRGIDLSEAMVAQLREEPAESGSRLRSAIFATTRVEDLSLAYLEFNTINNLASQDAQVGVLRERQRIIEPGGCFCEVGVPGLRTMPPGKSLRSSHLRPTTSGSTSTTRRTRGSSRTTSFRRRPVGAAVDPVPLRWPAELDLMARLAGCGCASAGAGGSESRSRATARSRSPSGRRRPRPLVRTITRMSVETFSPSSARRSSRTQRPRSRGHTLGTTRRQARPRSVLSRAPLRPPSRRPRDRDLGPMIAYAQTEIRSIPRKPIVRNWPGEQASLFSSHLPWLERFVSYWGSESSDVRAIVRNSTPPWLIGFCVTDGTFYPHHACRS